MEWNHCVILPRQCYHWVWAQIWNLSSKTHILMDCWLKRCQDYLVRLPEASSVKSGFFRVGGGGLLIINGSDYLLLGLSWRLRSVSLWFGWGFLPPPYSWGWGRLQSVPSVSLFLPFPSLSGSSPGFFPSPCYCSFTPWGSFFTLLLLCPLPASLDCFLWYRWLWNCTCPLTCGLFLMNTVQHSKCIFSSLWFS